MERIYPFDFALSGITVEFIAITTAILYVIGCVARRDAFRFQAADGRLPHSCSGTADGLYCQFPARMPGHRYKWRDACASISARGISVPQPACSACSSSPASGRRHGAYANGRGSCPPTTPPFPPPEAFSIPPRGAYSACADCWRASPCMTPSGHAPSASCGRQAWHCCSPPSSFPAPGRHGWHSRREPPGQDGQARQAKTYGHGSTSALPAPASESSFASRRLPPSGLPPMGSMPSAPTPYRDGSSSGRSSPEDFPTPLYAATEPCRRNTCPCKRHGLRHIPAARRPCLPVKTFTPSTNSCGWLSNPGLSDWRSSPAHWSRHSSNPPIPAGHPATQATSCWQSSASDASATPSLPLP